MTTAAQERRPTRESYGLNGPVYTVLSEETRFSHVDGVWTEGRRWKKQLRTFDRAGNLIETQVYRETDGKVDAVERKTYAHDENGWICVTEQLNKQGGYAQTSVKEVTLDALGRETITLVTETADNTDALSRIEYKYDDSTQPPLFEWTSYTSGKVLASYSKKFTPDGRRSTADISHYSTAGRNPKIVQHQTIADYDESGHVIKEQASRNSGGDLKILYTYDSDGRLIERAAYSRTNLPGPLSVLPFKRWTRGSSTRRVYDCSGRLREVIHDGGLPMDVNVKREEYKRDSLGNWIEITISESFTDDGKTITRIVGKNYCTISYYENTE